VTRLVHQSEQLLDVPGPPLERGLRPHWPLE
jgi:hypothetical protein